VFNDDRYEDLRLDARSILLGYVIALSLSLFPLMLIGVVRVGMAAPRASGGVHAGAGDQDGVGGAHEWSPVIPMVIGVIPIRPMVIRHLRRQVMVLNRSTMAEE